MVDLPIALGKKEWPVTPALLSDQGNWPLQNHPTTLLVLCLKMHRPWNPCTLEPISVPSCIGEKLFEALRSY